MKKKKEEAPKIKIPSLDPVTSSDLQAIGWTEEPNGSLFVQFKEGSIYVYWNVPQKIYDLLMTANRINSGHLGGVISVGSLFHYLCKIHPITYPFKKIS